MHKKGQTNAVALHIALRLIQLTKTESPLRVNMELGERVSHERGVETMIITTRAVVIQRAGTEVAERTPRVSEGVKVLRIVEQHALRRNAAAVVTTAAKICAISLQARGRMTDVTEAEVQRKETRSRLSSLVHTEKKNAVLAAVPMNHVSAIVVIAVAVNVMTLTVAIIVVATIENAIARDTLRRAASMKRGIVNVIATARMAIVTVIGRMVREETNENVKTGNCHP